MISREEASTPVPAGSVDGRIVPWPPDPVVEAYKRHVDRTVLRQNLRKTPKERVLALMELQRLAEEAHEAGGELRS